jgi:hypothetical protein
MEPTGLTAVQCPAFDQKEIMMMQQTPAVSPAATGPKQQIPQHLVERLEAEWKQMREATLSPVTPR